MAQEAMHPQVVKAVEVLEVIHSSEEKVEVAKERFLDVGLSIPRNF